MSIIRPYWFAQRQGKAEEAAPNVYRLTGPNLPERFIGIRRAEPGGWLAFLRTTADGPDVAITGAQPTEYEAWEAAFELFRTQEII